MSQAELPTSWKGAVYGQAADTIFSDETIIWEKSVAHIDTARSPRWSRTVIFAVLLLAITATFWAVERAGNNDERSGGVDTAAAAGGETTSGDETKSPLQEYLQFAGAAGSRGADVDQEYIVDGLRKLAGALGTLNLGSPDLQVDLRVAAEHILLNPASTATTEIVRNGLISAAEAIETGRPDGGDDLRRLAESVRPYGPFLDQRVTVHEFFQESAKAIQRVSRQT